MDRPESNYPPPPDFERASLAWVTKDDSHGRWRVIASTASWSPCTGEHDRFVLCARVMAGDVYGTGKLQRDPPYAFQIIASNQRHVIIRDFEQDLPNRDTGNSNWDIFSNLAIDVPSLQCERLDPDQLASDTMTRQWPLTARLRIGSGDLDHLVDFPVLHLNTKGTGTFQVETGPILLPGALVDDAALTTGGFALAFVFFNRLDRVDLALWGPTDAGAASRRGYVHFARRVGIAIELYGGKDKSSDS